MQYKVAGNEILDYFSCQLFVYFYLIDPMQDAHGLQGNLGFGIRDH